MSLPSFEAFDAINDQLSVGGRWTKWVCRFENFLTAMAINDEPRKLALLLHFAGPHVHDIYKTLDHTRNETAGVRETTLQQAIRVLTAHFNPKSNRQYAVHEFRKAEQKEGESIHQFYTRLVNLSTHCEFADVDREIKTQMIEKCASEKLSHEGLANSDWSLAKFIEMGAMWEAAEAQALRIKNKSSRDQDDSVSINTIHSSRREQSHASGSRRSYQQRDSQRDNHNAPPHDEQNTLDHRELTKNHRAKAAGVHTSANH